MCMLLWIPQRLPKGTKALWLLLGVFALKKPEANTPKRPKPCPTSPRLKPLAPCKEGALA